MASPKPPQTPEKQSLAPPSQEVHELSPLERERQQNIREKEQLLKDLGLDKPKALVPEKKKPTPRKKKAANKSLKPSRISLRIAASPRKSFYETRVTKPRTRKPGKEVRQKLSYNAREMEAALALLDLSRQRTTKKTSDAIEQLD